MGDSCKIRRKKGLYGRKTIDDMKKLMILAALSAVVLSCGKEEKVYTPEELGAIIEWGSSGWSEIYNDLEGTVTLTTTYLDMHDGTKTTEKSSVIQPGDFVKLETGACIPGVSIGESLSASIKLSDGSEILCTRGADNAWSKRFYETFTERQEQEIVEMDGKKVRHDLSVLTYHIDRTLVNLWQAGQ